MVEAKEKREVISTKVMDYAYGCDYHVSIFYCIVNIFCFSQAHIVSKTDNHAIL